MSEKPLPINEVVAHNLAVAMKQAKLSQASLAEKAGVSQKTVSNYLNPGQRQEGTSGKPASPKLVELESLGRALGMPVWKLTRPMSERERAMYEAIETAYLRLAEDAQAITSVSATDSGAMSAQQETRYAQDGKGDTALKRAGLPDLGGSDGADTKNRRASGAKGHRGS